MPEQRKFENGRFSAEVEKRGPYRVIRTGYWPVILQESRSVSVNSVVSVWRALLLPLDLTFPVIPFNFILILFERDLEQV